MDNYRPISVISIIAKIMEKLVHSQLFSYLERFDILIISQHGFRPLHSTVTALLKLTNQWYPGPLREFAGPGAKFHMGPL